MPFSFSGATAGKFTFHTSPRPCPASISSRMILARYFSAICRGAFMVLEKAMAGTPFMTASKAAPSVPE